MTLHPEQQQQHRVPLLVHLQTKPRLWHALIPRQAGCDPVPSWVAVCVHLVLRYLLPFLHVPLLSVQVSALAWFPSEKEMAHSRPPPNRWLPVVC
jgi:hypothetical protein